jgi:DMSO/TMAO reductase YedYZ molybdopterin-dependent catalytic subunit
MPAEIPRYTELDKDTGLHITGTAKIIELESYRLEVVGKVDHPLSLTYDELRCLPRVETDEPLECPGFFIDYASWAGVPIANVLELAEVHDDAVEILLVGADDYDIVVDINVARNKDNFLAYEWNGEPLPILHGFPVRAAFPGMAGRFWAKWLLRIEVH